MTKKLISFAALSDPADERAAELLYTAAFPPEERRPWDGILHPQSPYGPQLSIIRISYPDSAPRFAGIITVWEFETLRYIEHFAIDDCLRGSGIGADALRAVLAASPKPVVLEVEPPADDNPMAARRIFARTPRRATASYGIRCKHRPGNGRKITPPPSL